MLNKIVITGAPCTGKTEFIQWLYSNFDNMYCLPEAASILKKMGFPFDSVEERINFQHIVYDLQVSLEDLVKVHCMQDDAVLLCDRGTLDAFAYCDLCDAIDMNTQFEYERYNAVLHFRCATTSEIYEASRYGNSLRDEEYERALELDNKLLNLWKNHLAYYKITWEIDKNKKYNRALEILSTILKLKMKGI